MNINGTFINLRLVEVSDAPFILSLRIDGRLNRFLSAVGDDVGRQFAWLESYKARERRGEEFYWIIEDLASVSLGTIRLYDMDHDDRSFTWGSWILKAGSPPQFAMESAILMYDFGFYTLRFGVARMGVRKGNTGVVAFHRRFGASPAGEDEQNLDFRLIAEDYAVTRRRYADLLKLRGI